MTRSYNALAPYYDSLSRLVYGNALQNALIFLVKHISAHSSILVVGGGTGAILEDICGQYSEGLHITYIDSSSKMIEQAKRKKTGNNAVVFICQPIQDVVFFQSFDIIITPFFFDNFSSNTAANVFNKLNDVLIKDGLWLYADFNATGNVLWQKLMLKFMYRFFRLLCNIEARQLPDIKLLFQRNRYQLTSVQTFYRQFICAEVYKKLSPG